MATYKPDCWVIISVKPLDEPVFYRVFATWVGGFAAGDRWKINSGITSAAKLENFLYFSGASGSTYICHGSGYGTTAYSAGILNGFIRGAEGKALIEVLPASTDWLGLDYSHGQVD